jgi:hypothetical protein
VKLVNISVIRLTPALLVQHFHRPVLAPLAVLAILEMATSQDLATAWYAPPLARSDHTALEVKYLVRLAPIDHFKITLDKLNRLRIMNDTRKLEHEQKLEKVGAQYKAPAAAAGGL